MRYLNNVPYVGDLAAQLGAVGAPEIKSSAPLIVGAFKIPSQGPRDHYAATIQLLDEELAYLATLVGPSGLIVLILQSAQQKHFPLGYNIDRVAASLSRQLSVYTTSAVGNDVTVIAITVTGAFDPKLLTGRIEELQGHSYQLGDHLVIRHTDIVHSTLKQIIEENTL